MPEQSRDDRMKAHRVSEARRLLDEPLLNEAFDKIEKAAIEEMLKLPFWASRRMRMLADRIRVIRGTRAHLAAVIINGEQALKRPTRVA